MAKSRGRVPSNKRQPKKDAFLAAYAKVGVLGRAAELAKCNRNTHYEWLKDSEYAKAFDEAHEQACESLETEARRRAVEGTDKPVFHQGTQCGVIREYSDTLLIFLMKGAMPKKYRENYSHEHSGPEGKAIQVESIDVSKLSTEQLTQLQAILGQLGQENTDA